MATDDRRYALGPDEGLGGARKSFAQPLRMLATGAETTLEYTLFEQRLERGYAPPLHVHHIEDEAFYLVDGAIEVACGDVRWQLAPRRLRVPAAQRAARVPGGSRTPRSCSN
ncbi:hypothetical protein ACU686_31690 [Yinghuangia aomiensis]